MQGAWANVVRHNPEIQQGDWVAYYNGESKKGDTLWPGRAKVIDPGHSHKDKVVVDWYGLNGNTEALTLEPPQDGEEAWHLDRKFCYKVSQGYNSHTKNMVDSNPTHDTYLVISTNKERDKIKVTPENILLDEQNMRPAEKYGPAFIKRNQNSSLYGAQMLRSCINKIKPNKWAENYGINLSKVRQEHLSTFASSKIKGFM
jgi:hypothetical protein